MKIGTEVCTLEAMNLIKLQDHFSHVLTLEMTDEKLAFQDRV